MSSPIAIDGHLYDGQTSARTAATLRVDQEGVASVAVAEELADHFSRVIVSSRIGNSARYLTFTSGHRFETLQNDAIDALCQQWLPAKHGLADRLERNMKVVFVAILVVLVGGFAFAKYGIPALSKPITASIPLSVDQRLGSETLAAMDKRFVKPSKLSDERQQALRNLFAGLPQNAAREYQLLLRDTGKMANAFALPNGTIVMTDALVKMADNDLQLQSILLHEIGHVEHRHSMQMLVQQAGLSLLLLLITGDVNAASNIIILLPGWLVQASYSQALEWEADTYALEEMQKRGLDTNAFAEIMSKLNEGAAAGSNKQDSTIFDYLSTHPPTRERIARFRVDTPAGVTSP
ncbi:MAG: M48 family metallopeptidase [Pseudomonadales bacterium]